MTGVAIVALILVLLLVWFVLLARCQHQRATGIANYFDHDHHCFVHLKECDDCGAVFITREEPS